MQLRCDLKASGLQPHGTYDVSIETQDAKGAGISEGVTGGPADEKGHVDINLIPFLLSAIAETGGPCDVTIWLRPAGSPFNDHTLGPKYQLTTTVV